MPRIKKKIARKFARQNYTGLQSHFNIFFYSVCQSTVAHMFEYFVRPHVCLSVSVGVAFYFKLHFGREGRRFESGSWFLGAGVSVFCEMEFCWGGVGGGGLTLIS